MAAYSLTLKHMDMLAALAALAMVLAVVASSPGELDTIQ